MKTRELFIKAIQNELANAGKTQSKLADDLKITRPLMSNFLKMKPKGNFSEERKEIISEYFGKSYYEMLKLGEELLTEVPDSHEEQEIIDAATRIVSESLIDSGVVVSEVARQKIVKIAKKEIEERMEKAKSKARRTVGMVLDAIDAKE